MGDRTSAFPGESQDVFRELDRLLGLADEWGSVNHGDEGAGRWFPLLVPWDEQIDGARLTETSLLVRLGAHRELLGATCTLTPASLLDLLSRWCRPAPCDALYSALYSAPTRAVC